MRAEGLRSDVRLSLLRRVWCMVVSRLFNITNVVICYFAKLTSNSGKVGKTPKRNLKGVLLFRLRDKLNGGKYCI